MSGLDPATGLPVGARLRPEHEVPPREAAQGMLIVDCRLPEELETARVEGSVLIPLHELESRLDDLEEALGERGLGRESPFAVLCHHGHRSLRAALLLQQHGFTGARSVFGGIDLWAMDVDRSIPRYERQGARCTIAGSVPLRAPSASSGAVPTSVREYARACAPSAGSASMSPECKLGSGSDFHP